MAAQYKSTNKLNRASEAPSPLPEKIGIILQESRWLALIALASFIGLALWGFNRADPGWSPELDAAPRRMAAGSVRDLCDAPESPATVSVCQQGAGQALAGAAPGDARGSSTAGGENR